MRNSVVVAALGILAVVALMLWLRRPPAVARDLHLTEHAQKRTETAIDAYVPRIVGRLDDLAVPADMLLLSIPGVAQVDRLVAVEKPTHRLIHVLDVPVLSRAAHDEGLAKSGKEFTEPQKDALYRGHLTEVELLQIEQAGLLRCLARHYGLKTVFVAGGEDPAKRAAEVRGLPVQIAELRDELEDVRQSMRKSSGDARKSGREVEARIQGVIDERSHALLQVRVVPRLGEELQVTRWGENAPVGATVNTVLDAGAAAVIVLDGAHDLSDLVRKLQGCEYLRAWMRSYAR